MKNPGWSVIHIREEVHVLPINDVKKHKVGGKCWCNPKPDDEFETMFTHNSMDRREEFERGRKMS